MPRPEHGPLPRGAGIRGSGCAAPPKPPFPKMHADPGPRQVLKLLDRPEAWLRVAAIRFLRTCLDMKDEFYNRYIAKNGLLGAVLRAFVANGRRYNLLNSAVLELLDFVWRVRGEGGWVGVEREGGCGEGGRVCVEAQGGCGGAGCAGRECGRGTWAAGYDGFMPGGAPQAPAAALVRLAPGRAEAFHAPTADIAASRMTPHVSPFHDWAGKHEGHPGDGGGAPAVAAVPGAG